MDCKINVYFIGTIVNNVNEFVLKSRYFYYLYDGGLNGALADLRLK